MTDNHPSLTSLNTVGLESHIESQRNRHIDRQMVSDLYKHFVQHLAIIDPCITPAITETLWQSIVGYYSEPIRAYHNLTHLQQLFEQFAQVKNKLRQPSIVALALFYHDIIYDPSRQDNELKSAVFLEQAYAKLLPSGLIARIYQLIIMTASHELIDQTDTDAAYLLDMDLSILASDWLQYEQYAQAIRREYAHVTNADYRSGRTSVLAGLLTHPRLYLTDYYQRLEQQARQNISRELAFFAAV